ncbi:hypothetical protein [Chitinibacter sp. GC72]|uniref:hypothetical protein n=1 Tax=Chitinibacter sp. GC72 TaxID=1526917 RepID=UPI0012FB2B23|nr:hypothetical protein [Chitinibacter sp. GC72]
MKTHEHTRTHTHEQRGCSNISTPGVPVSYPLWAINDQQWCATASILPEQFTVQDNGELLWRDAEGISRTMRRVQAVG